MTSFLSTHGFLPSLKRQPAVRNRGSISRSKTAPIAFASSSTKSRKHLTLSVLSEEPEEELASSSTFSHNRSRSDSPQPAAYEPSRAHVNINAKDIRVATATKRLSRYGRAEFAGPQGLGELEEDMSLMAPRPAPRPPVSVQTRNAPAPAPAPAARTPSPPRPAAHSPDLLSMFETSFDLSNLPSPSPLHSDADSTPASPQTNGRRSHSPSSVFSDSTSASVGMPATPTTSDDELPPLTRSRKSVVPQRISIRPLVITKSITASHLVEDSPVDTFTFTIAPSMTVDLEDEHEPESEPEREQADDEWVDDDGAWYSREMSDVFTLLSSAPVPSPARPDSLPPTPRFIPGEYRSVRRTTGFLPFPRPSAQLDPAFPRRRRVPLPTRAPPPPPPSGPRYRSHRGSVNRKSLTIAVPVSTLATHAPRPLPRTPIPSDAQAEGADIFDDFSSWDVAPFAHNLETVTPAQEARPLSPPRLPQTPQSSGSASTYSHPSAFPDAHAFEPLPLSLPTSPLHLGLFPASPRRFVEETSVHAAPAALEYVLTPAVVVDQEHEQETETEEGHETGFEPMLRSRWSSSTLGSLAAEPSTVSSRLLRFPFGKRARARRSSAVAEKEREKAKDREREGRGRGREARMSIDSTSSSEASKSESGESNTSSGLRRKPIPVEMFIRR